jgi:hypothetical protein
LGVLAEMAAEDNEPATARRWLDRAIKHFDLLGGDAGMAYCRALERTPGVAAGSATAGSAAADEPAWQRPKSLQSRR